MNLDGDFTPEEFDKARRMEELSDGHRCVPDCRVPLTWQSDAHWTRALDEEIRLRYPNALAGIDVFDRDDWKKRP